ncbi:MAG: 5,6-dimethylbenzimidazole synthase, partial [Nitrospira defluvii]|nr:5,6-dimethylbenzimidazole synthase [Nitrospira defluvii]
MLRSTVDPQEPFSIAEREAVYRAIFERRDVRRNFLPTPIPDEVL